MGVGRVDKGWRIARWSLQYEGASPEDLEYYYRVGLCRRPSWIGGCCGHWTIPGHDFPFQILFLTNSLSTYRHDFEWKREECFMIRKPDPPVLVAVTKEPPGKLKTAAVQILDYNLNRFDIDDRKGLEIVILTALLTFHDLNDTYHNTPEGSSSSSIPQTQQQRKPSGDALPVVPPKPPIKMGKERIMEMHAFRGDVNEITVEEEGGVDDYAEFAAGLLDVSSSVPVACFGIERMCVLTFFFLVVKLG